MRTKFTVAEKMAGERIINRLSEKAQYVYNETDPFRVYEYDNTYGGRRRRCRKTLCI
ncbi:MAG: hypothetical protein ACLS4R_05880 [Roseburia inulinivorans]